LNNIKNEFTIKTTTLISLAVIFLIIMIFPLIKKKKPAPIVTITICAGLGIIISYLLV